jgi:hypothetical protein
VLVNFADNLLLRISPDLMLRNTPGNKSIRRLEGINSVNAEIG